MAKTYIATEDTLAAIKNLVATEDTLAAIKNLVQDIEATPSGSSAHITVEAPTGCTVTATSGSTVLTSTEENGTYQFNLPHLGDWVVAVTKDGRTGTRTVSAAAVAEYKIKMSYGYRYGFRINESEGAPASRVEYLFDAVGKEPAAMNFTTGVFNYGDWADLWFVKDNKPCMLKRSGKVDYYLNPNNYAYKEDGTASDVSNTSYNGNAMSEIPLVWVKRYTDGNYRYVIFSDVQYDEDYKADAFIRSDGTVADVFYYSMFGGSGSSSMIRSLSGQTRLGSTTMAQEFAGAAANGALWSTHTWSRYNLIRDLCTLIGKSTNFETVFGYGNCCGASSSSSIKTTGTLKANGQFYGSASYSSQVKVFHIEAFWGDMWDRLAGILVNSYEPYVLMSRAGGKEYSASSISQYTGTGLTIPSGMSSSYITGEAFNQYGSFPSATGGSSSTYYCDGGWSASGLTGLLVGVGADNSGGVGGGFTWSSSDAPSISRWIYGCGLSCEAPADA